MKKGISLKLKHNTLSKSDEKVALTLILPSAIIIFGVLFYPIIYSFIMSLNKINLATRAFDFRGLANYAMLLQDNEFISSILLTLYFTVITVICEMILGTCIALVLNKDFKGCGFLRGLMILPWALPSVVNAIMWKGIFNSSYGALNALLSQLHFITQYQVWLGQSNSALNCLIYANIWKETPYVSLLMLAGLANISNDLYEAANIDGSNAWNSFWRIMLPILTPVTIVLMISKTIWAIQTFDLPYILNNGGPANGTELISLYIQKTAFSFQQFGYASAMSYMLMLVTFIICLLYIKLISKNGEAGLTAGR